MELAREGVRCEEDSLPSSAAGPTLIEEAESFRTVSARAAIANKASVKMKQRTTEPSVRVASVTSILAQGIREFRPSHAQYVRTRSEGQLSLPLVLH